MLYPNNFVHIPSPCQVCSFAWRDQSKQLGTSQFHNLNNNKQMRGFHICIVYRAGPLNLIIAYFRYIYLGELGIGQ